jgi:hypothetical protein
MSSSSKSAPLALCMLCAPPHDWATLLPCSFVFLCNTQPALPCAGIRRIPKKIICSSIHPLLLGYSWGQHPHNGVPSTRRSVAPSFRVIMRPRPLRFLGASKPKHAGVSCLSQSPSRSLCVLSRCESSLLSRFCPRGMLSPPLFMDAINQQSLCIRRHA